MPPRGALGGMYIVTCMVKLIVVLFIAFFMYINCNFDFRLLYTYRS